ncbi:MAG TPA: 8-oxoguanine deaminase [Chloroflexota bacterium]|jgi:cytosine/adenosine deaminase-related metal-dependent hydrolase
MATLLVRHADLVVAMDDAESQWADGAVYCLDNRIEQVGPSADLPEAADRVVDARGMLVMPGLINSHHHFCQTLTRALPAAQNGTLFQWLSALYPIWARITPAAVRAATRTAIAELILSGCTCSSDHTYLWPNGARLDDQIEVAAEMGFRFHAARGSMSVGQSKGGLPPDNVVEDEEHVLWDTRRLIEQYHDPGPRAMVRVVVAPCSPFTVSPDLMRESARLARAYGVHLHTHLAETLDEERYCRSRFGRRPAEYAEQLDWAGADVWHAHCVHLSDDECARLGRVGTGAAHCPSSNMRLASGVAPLAAMLAAGMRVGLGVDGSASNDSSHLLAEARQALLLRRLATMDPGALTARAALRLATRGGAAALGRDDLGQLRPGLAADLVGFRIDSLPLAGAAVHDPLAALVFCHPQPVELSVIDGRVRVEGGQMVDADVGAIAAEQNRIARELLRA